MLEQLRDHCTKPEDAKAIEWLGDPSSFPSLSPQSSSKIVLQLYIQPSFHPVISWTLFKQSESTYLVRRVRWDFIADHQVRRHGLVVTEPSIYGADAVCPSEPISSALSELATLTIPAFDASSCFGIDGVSYGFRRSSFSQTLEFSWWAHPPKGCEAIASWHHRFSDQLEEFLPAHTDQFRLSSIRPQ